MNYGKTKPKLKSVKPSKQPSWEQVRKFPVRLFQTLKGPIIGHVEAERARSVRVWAPAMLMTPTPVNVLYMPIAFCEEYIDLFWGVLFGTHPASDIVIKGYEGYVTQFIAGGYAMRPVVINAGVEGEMVEQPLEDRAPILAGPTPPEDAATKTYAETQTKPS